MTLEHLEPQLVWKHFARLCGIPRPSGHEEGVRRYLLDFAAEHHLASAVDETGNVVIRKAATPGNDHAPAVILQGHLDMVPQKNLDRDFDFVKDPIQPVVDGDWVRADGTTLGADDGMGVAAALAVLEDSTATHGPLTCLFTVEEETGLRGALNTAPDFLRGQYLFNLDTEEEGVACIGCAGGARTDFLFDIEWETTPEASCGLTLKVGGLLGGHSGMDINRGRGNAVKLMAETLEQARQKFGFRTAALNGGNLDNAIPREAVALGALPDDRAADMSEWLTQFNAELAIRFKASDPDVNVTMVRAEVPDRVWTLDLQQHVLAALVGCRNGAQSFVEGMPDLVETSSNLAAVITEGGGVKITTSQRSAVDRERDVLVADLERFFGTHGALSHRRSSYPGWPVEAHSPLTDLAGRVFRGLFQRDLRLEAIHAGVECGIFKGKNPKLQMISFGPQMEAVHSPDERVNIPSVERFYRFLLQLLSASTLK